MLAAIDVGKEGREALRAQPKRGAVRKPVVELGEPEDVVLERILKLGDVFRLVCWQHC